MKERTRRVHIVGCHRSGTTLLAQLMWYGFQFDARAEHEASLFEPTPDVGVYLSKKPPDTVRINNVFFRDPDLFLIAMIRDPRAVITSRHPRRPDVYFSNFHRWEKYLQAIETAEGHERYLVVRYEALVTEPDRIQDQIANRLRFLKIRRPFSGYPVGADVPTKARISLNGIRHIDGSGLHRWQNELPRLKGELLRHPNLSGWLVKLGYEPDDAWVRCLDDVEPLFQSYKSADPGLLRRAETSLRYLVKTVAYVHRRGLRWL